MGNLKSDAGTPGDAESFLHRRLDFIALVAHVSGIQTVEIANNLANNDRIKA